MLFSPSVILEKIQNDFTTVNESFSGFPESGNLWDECIRTVKDATLMNHIIFNNDVMEIPPVRTFLKANQVLDGGFNTYQKKALDAFWGFVFRDIFFYAGQEDNAKVNVMGVRKAARFINPQSEVMVGDLDEASGKIVVPVPRQKLRMNLAEPGRTSVNPTPELHRTDDQRTDDLRIADQSVDGQRVVDQRVVDQRVVDQRAEDQRLEQQRLEEQRIADQRAVDQSVEGQRFEEQRIADQRTDDQTIAGQRVPDQHLEDQRIEEQRISDQRIENQRDADRMVEEQRLTEQRLAEQRIENQKLGEAGAEEPAVEEKRIEELRIREPRV